MVMASEVVIGLVGGVIGLVLASGFESFLFWTTVIISGLFLFTHVTNLTQSLESKFPILIKVHLYYLCIWTSLLLIDLVICIISFKLILIVVAALLASFAVDLFLKYKKWKSGGGSEAPPSGSGEPPVTPSSLESGGKY